MRIIYSSIFVDDQEKALQFYTEILGFIKKYDIPVGEFRWISLVSSDEQNSTQLLLEPNENPAASEFQKAIYAQNIPSTSFGVDDVYKEYERLTDLGVKFTMQPTEMESIIMAVFDDTCGNLIQIEQLLS